jgi:hypothetical protein
VKRPLIPLALCPPSEGRNRAVPQFERKTSMTNTQTPRDLYRTITDRVVASIEAGAPNFEMG